MTEQQLLEAEPAAVPTDSKWSKSISSDHEPALRKAQEGLGRRVADHSTTLAQANEQLRHEINERQRAEELLLKEQRYLRYLLELQDRDRQMVSYEIHDGLVQQLAAAIMQFEVFSRVAEQKAKEVWKTFASGVGMLNECMREARRLVNGLRSPILDELGLVVAVEDLISQDSAQDKPEIDFVHHLDCERLAPSLENVIFRIIQESLTNARRYSQSERVLVRLTQRDHCTFGLRFRIGALVSTPRRWAKATLAWKASRNVQDCLGARPPSRVPSAREPGLSSSCRSWKTWAP
jgi:signal transduction histidine kinase